MQVVEYAKKNSEALELIFDAKSTNKFLRTENWHFATLCNGVHCTKGKVDAAC